MRIQRTGQARERRHVARLCISLSHSTVPEEPCRCNDLLVCWCVGGVWMDFWVGAQRTYDGGERRRDVEGKDNAVAVGEEGDAGGDRERGGLVGGRRGDAWRRSGQQRRLGQAAVVAAPPPPRAQAAVAAKGAGCGCRHGAQAADSQHSLLSRADRRRLLLPQRRRPRGVWVAAATGARAGLVALAILGGGATPMRGCGPTRCKEAAALCGVLWFWWVDGGGVGGNGGGREVEAMGVMDE